MIQNKSEFAAEAVKSSPAVAVTGLGTVGGVTLNEWVAITTIAYIVVQIVILLRREWRARKDRPTRTVRR